MALSECNVLTDSLQKETTLYGSVGFPVACYEDDMKIISVPAHWHEEFEFIAAIKGVVTVLADGKRLELTPGEAVFLNSECLHGVESVINTDSVLRSLTILPSFIGGTPESSIFQKVIAPFGVSASPSHILLQKNTLWEKKIIESMLMAWTAVQTESYDFENEARYQIAKALHLLADHLTETHSSCRPNDAALERIKKVISYMEEHYSEEIGNRELMQLISCSESVLLRNFRQITGTSPMQFLISYRIQKASELLLSSDLKASAVASSCGFHDNSYFTKIFGKMMGMTPVRYRELYR